VLCGRRRGEFQVLGAGLNFGAEISEGVANKWLGAEPTELSI
jgi:hypothetical protein